MAVRKALNEQLVQPFRQLGPPGVPGTLRRDDDKRKIPVLSNVLRKPGSQHGARIVSRLSKTVKKQNSRPLPLRGLTRLRGQVKQIA